MPCDEGLVDEGARDRYQEEGLCVHELGAGDREGGSGECAGAQVMTTQEKLNQALARIKEKDALIALLQKKVEEQEAYIVELRRNTKGVSGQ